MNNRLLRFHELPTVFLILLMSFSRLHSQSIQEVESMNNQAQALLKQGQYTQSVALSLNALKLSEDVLGLEHPATADSLNNLGAAYQALGDYTKAESSFLRGLKIREKALGPEHQFTARNLGNLGVLYLRMGENTKAEPLLQRALAIDEKVLGPNSSAAATMVGCLGDIYRNIGDYAKAEIFLKRALQTYEQILGPEDPKTLTCLGNLAGTYWAMGDYANAESLLSRVLAIREKVQGPEHRDTAMSLEQLATLYVEIGDYAKAESFYQRALTIQERKLGPQHPDTANTLAGLALLYMRIGDYAKTEALLQRALKIQEESLGSEHPATAQTLIELAAFYDQKGDYAKLEPLYLRVLRIQEKRLGSKHPDVAVTLRRLAILYKRMQHFPKAEVFGERALQIDEDVLGPEHPAVADCLSDLGSVYVNMGNYSDAEPLFERAVRIDEKILGPDHPRTLIHFENLGVVYLDENKTSEALHMAERAEQERLSMLANILSFTSERQRLSYQTQERPYNLFASLGSARQITLTLLRHKGVVLDSLLEDRLVAQAGKNPEDRGLIEQLGPAKQRLMELIFQPPKDSSEQAFKDRAATRERSGQDVERLEGALAQKVAGLGYARRALSVTVEQVQKSIPGQSALVEFLRYPHCLGKGKWETRYGAVVLASTGDPKWACLGSAAVIEEHIGLIQESIRNRTNELALIEELKGLYRQIWAPLEPLLPPGSKTVMISPDGSLNFVSFATLLTPGDQFLAENHSIGYVTSGRDLLSPVHSLTNTDMVVFGNPDYAGDGGSASSNALPPLPGTAAEATALEIQAKKWNWPVQIYLGTNSTETQMRAIHSPHILHVATHGFFRSGMLAGMNRSSFSVLDTNPNGFETYTILSSPMLRSGIFLAGAQATLDAWERGEIPPTDKDGIVTAEEVGSLDLTGTWLVTLSACDTGVGGVKAGEGVMGLRRGFIQAGAQNLLMTLWPVLDKTTSQFMLDFYSLVQKNGNPPEALARTQRDWLVNLRKKYSVRVAVVVAGPFILSFQGPLPSD